MDEKKLASTATPKSIGAYLARQARDVQQHAGHNTIRTATHRDHEIAVETVYRISIDGKRIKLPLTVDMEGNVHCHALPNYQTGSVIDLIKIVIDSFPDAFPARAKSEGPHSGMDMPARTRSGRRGSRK